VLALDGVYVRDTESGKLEFRVLRTPTRTDVEDVARRTAERIEKLLRKARRLPGDARAGAGSRLVLDDDALQSK
jgi:hypothetical protein